MRSHNASPAQRAQALFGPGSYALGMAMRKTALVLAMLSSVLISACVADPGPVAEPPPPPATTNEVDSPTLTPSAFSAACEAWDPGALEWRELSGQTQEEASDDAGLQVSLSRSSLPPSEASRYNAGVEICPDFLWIVTHAGESRFVSLADHTWAEAPRLSPSGSTDNIGATGVESGGPVWGFRGALATGDWVYLSDAVVDTINQCVRVDVHRLATEDLLRGNSDTTVIYESTPCVDYTSADRARTPIKTHMGGALAYSPERDELYVSLGDFHLGASRIGQAVAAGLEATERDYALLLDDTSALSAVVAVSSPDSIAQSRIFAKGLRNSLGMTVDDEGVLWLTDHGPGGGDELNVITEGADYGWPLTSEGQPYDRSSWPSDPTQLLAPWLDIFQADVPGTTTPLLSWTPAIAPSNIVHFAPATTTIPEWSGDLILGSLRGESLIRITQGADGSLSESRLRVGERIRDVILTSGGSLALLTDSSTLITVGR
jgi:hypothetical protein